MQQSHPDVPATASVSYTGTETGDLTVTLADPRLVPFGFVGGTISQTTSQNITEPFQCSTNAGDYTNGSYNQTHPNTATLTGGNTNLSANATVTVNCTMPPPPSQWAGETATGSGTKWPGTSNWFMYTGYTTSKVDLIAGQHHDAGDIFMSRSGTTTTIRIVLHDGWRWADVKENLKVIPLDNAPKSYIEPGAFPHKFTVSGNEISVNIPNSSKAKFFGIHGDVERRLP